MHTAILQIGFDLETYLLTYVPLLQTSEEEFLNAIDGSLYLTELEAHCKSKGIPLELPRIKRFREKAIHNCPSCGTKMSLIPYSGLLCDNKECEEFVAVSVGKESSQTQQKTSGRDLHEYVKEFWQRLIGAAKFEAGADVIDAVQIQLRRSGFLYKRQINAEVIRLCLQLSDLSKYYADAGIIMARLEGNSVRITPEENELIIEKLTKAAHISKTLETKRNNIPYTGYLAMRVVEQVIQDPIRIEKIRRLIHMQSDKTVSKNDEHWKDILARMNSQSN